TPEYMAPELVEHPATPASDTYALGILVYQMLTGQVPFKGTTPVSIVWKHLKEQPESPSKLNPAIPYEVEQVILGALEKNPQRRFQKPRDFQQAYQRALYGAGNAALRGGAALPSQPPVNIQVIPASEMRLQGTWSFAESRRLVVLGFVAFLLVLLLLFGIVLFQLHHHSPSTPATATPTYSMPAPKKHSL
ncbi:MAG TPA: protein kinase, partial [Ktedonobacteraceae bacterium]